MNVKTLFDSFKHVKVAVIGDIMLDTYWWGKVERISPEAPVPVVSIEHKEYRLGGAGNVALNLVTLGANVTMMTVIGNDEDALLLEQIMHNKHIQSSALYKSEERVTTNKIRIISRNQQMMRLDKEMAFDISKNIEKEFLRIVQHYIETETPQLVIFEDYNKGILTENIITQVIHICKEYNIITAVDPKRKNFFSYKGVDIFKPNLKEVYDAFNLLDMHIDRFNLEIIHTLLHEKLQHHISYITLSEKGVFYSDGNNSEIFPAYIRNVADVSGAGDTVIAVAALVYTVTKDKSLMAEIGNLAGGIVCEAVGTVAIDKNKLFEECEKII